MKVTKILLTSLAIIAIVFLFAYGHARKAKKDLVFDSYVEYFKSIYEIMDREYYEPVYKPIYQEFIANFRDKIYYKQIKDKSKVSNEIKHLGAGLLVSKLKDVTDPFTSFYPPQMVKEFKQSVLGFGADIGLEGEVKDGRFIISQVELNSDSFKKGISTGDEVLKVDNQAVSGLTLDQIRKIFSAPPGKEVILEVFFPHSKRTSVVSVVSAQYFKQSVFLVPTFNPAVACLKIKFFNQDTGNQMRSFIDSLNKKNIGKLIIDLRDNSGGPPLAAWDISGLFLEPEQRLFYFIKRQQAPSGVVVSSSPVHFKGDIAILINKGTGSASELFAGIMQAYHRSGLIGENTAGKVFLKSLFDLSDGATLELTVAKGYLFNGEPIPADGLKPDIAMPDNDGLLNSAVRFMETAARSSK